VFTNNPIWDWFIHLPVNPFFDDWLGWCLNGAATFFVYFFPWLLAVARRRNRLPIFVLNAALGWTFIGWVGGLVWAVY
jgi:hypothetical protein